jgi:hypothetical protein
MICNSIFLADEQADYKENKNVKRATKREEKLTI